MNLEKFPILKIKPHYEYAQHKEHFICEVEIWKTQFAAQLEALIDDFPSYEIGDELNIVFDNYYERLKEILEAFK